MKISPNSLGTGVKPESGDTSFSMCIASGPFTPDADLKYTAWQTLIESLKTSKPTVLLLVRKWFPNNFVQKLISWEYRLARLWTPFTHRSGAATSTLLLRIFSGNCLPKICGTGSIYLLEAWLFWYLVFEISSMTTLFFHKVNSALDLQPIQYVSFTFVITLK